MESVIPEVQDIVLQQDIPVRERVDRVADAYFRVFTAHPSLHQFVIREMQRDVGLLLTTVKEQDCEQRSMKTITCLQEDMKQETLKNVLLPFVSYTLYSLLTIPFLSHPLATMLFLHEGEASNDLLRRWKPYVIMHVANLLDPQ